ncbi:FAD-dependent monooxygenase [Pseudonocardia sp. S2-4]|uniref:FAD-dependent monooxygenase n=2 Tax=Pseudonocardia humida TaxID=2800819 RepID=A0ABT1A765_9PSEU|nr:FAD-dependent monooxygenase [Pseudonocardia humida]
MTDVLVVGAGPTGLAVACGLRLHGISVRVVDSAPGPATSSRANFVHARGSEVLDRLGALGDLPGQSLRAMKITTYLGDKPIMNLRFGDPGMRTAAPPMVISQAKVEAELRRRLAELDCTPEWNAGLVDATADDAGVTAELSDGQVVRAQWLVGCDGTGSATRKLAGVGFPGVKLSERFLLADLHLDWNLDRTGTTGWIHPTGMLGAMPMPDPDGRSDLWRLIAYDPGHDEKPSDQEILDRFHDILPERTDDPDVRILDAVWLSLFSVHRRLADTYRQGRILLAGDAAHTHAPFGGQGMLTGLGDAENLAWKLALVVRGRAGEALMDTYQAERRPLAMEVLRGTSAVTRINVAQSRVGRFLRDRVIAQLFNQPWIQRWATYTTSQLWVSYRKGPLGSRFGRKPRPGDRVDDLKCVRADGMQSRLHAELGGHWAMLLPKDGAEACAATVRHALGTYVVLLRQVDDSFPDEVLLVRPDAHIAWRGRDDAAALLRWLDSALHGGRAKR